MFFGEFHHQIDDKGRLRIPPRFLKLLGEGSMMTVGFENCIMLYTKEGFEKFVYSRLEQTDFLNLNAADVKRVLFSKTQGIVLDKQGRVAIDSSMLEKCGLKKNVITIGAMDHAEIWDEDAYNEHMNALDIKGILAALES